MKQPYKRFEPDPCHWTRTEARHWKQKKAYDTEDEAEEWLNQRPKLSEQGMKSYLCPICQKWHLGHLK